MTFAALPVIALGVSAATAPEAHADEPAVASPGFQLLPLATRQRLFFKYEKRVRERATLGHAMTPMKHCNIACPSPHLRIAIPYFLCPIQIRERSSLEKVFAYFSSAAQDNARYMLPQDLVHALVPTYPPLESSIERAGRLDGRFPSACGAVRPAPMHAAAKRSS